MSKQGWPSEKLNRIADDSETVIPFAFFFNDENPNYGIWSELPEGSGHEDRVKIGDGVWWNSEPWTHYVIFQFGKTHLIQPFSMMFVCKNNAVLTGYNKDETEKIRAEFDVEYGLIIANRTEQS